MDDWRGKVVWITGASSGIGRELAVRLAAQGAWVFGSARNADALAELHRVSAVEALPCDVGDRSAVLAAATVIRERAGRLDVLVANAGTCEYVDVKAFDGALFERVFNANLFGAVYSVEAALPLLRAGDTRHIVGIGSTAAWTGLPRAEAYGASKAALHYFLDSLRVDLTAENFRVTVVAPGFVETPLTDRNDFPMPMRITVEQAVDYLLQGLAAGRLEIAFPPGFSRTLKALRLMPVPLRNRLYQKLVRP
ncbi:MAG: SDR family NAD(P)-dependent oxidoreductase [Gammaproteobacteria bacterium]